MDDASFNVNAALEAEMFNYYHDRFVTIMNVVDRYEDGNISLNEMFNLIKGIRASRHDKETEFTEKYEYIHKHYQLGGILRAWYRSLAR